MATPAQIAANKLNAEKSTGPKTPEGKAKSSMNRLTHGFASPACIIPGEDGAILMALINDLKAEFEPATTTEEILVEKMAQAQWLTQRALNLQGEAFCKRIRRPQEPRTPHPLPHFRRTSLPPRSQRARKDPERKEKVRNWVRSAKPAEAPADTLKPRPNPEKRSPKSSPRTSS